MTTLSVRGNTNWNSSLYLDLTLTVTETKTDDSNNISTVSYSCKAVQNGTVNYFTGTTRNNGGTVNFYINGTKVGTKVVPVQKQSAAGNLTHYNTSGTLNIPHNDDGSKTIVLKAEVIKGSGNYANDAYVWGSKSGTQNMTLTKLDLTKIRYKLDGVWKKVKAYIKVGGAWKKINKPRYKKSGAYK